MTTEHAALSRVSKTTLTGLVVEQIRNAILAGAFEFGAQLNEAELARRLGVSRGPVREALQRLVQEGLLTSRPHRGVFVPELTDADLADIFLAREAVESASLRRIVAAGRAAEAAEVLMRQVTAMGEAEAAKDWASVVECDMAFHRDLVDCADSFRLSRMYTVLIAETKLCLHMLFGGYRWREGIVEEHARLARILAHGDLGAVLGELRLHLRSPAAAGHEAPARAGKPR